MAVPSHRLDADADTSEDRGVPSVRDGISMHTTSPGRRVFVESGNTDGWIATDLTVDLER